MVEKYVKIAKIIIYVFRALATKQRGHTNEK